MNDFKKYIYLNNLSDIITISKDEKFDTLLNKLDDVKVKVSSHLIHDKNNISSYEQFFFNLDNYITFLKNHLFINQFEIRIIVTLTIYNKYNKILYDKDYYYKNIKKYEDSFIKMFMYSYIRNISFINKYIYIKKRSFEELIDNINKSKKRSYSYFENINSKNITFYIPIFEKLEDIN
ncbi:MAG: hypothetical protein IKR57_03945 [Bacilli bacterium]|nr:hypothetical protein [Bacilli bacterium]